MYSSKYSKLGSEFFRLPLLQTWEVFNFTAEGQ